MNGAATTAEWLTCTGIGTGATTVVLGLLKLAVDGPPELHLDRAQSPPPAPRAALPARAPRRRPRHAATPAVDETQPIHCVQPARARHAKKAA